MWMILKKYSAKKKNPDAKDYILYNLIYMKYSEKGLKVTRFD